MDEQKLEYLLYSIPEGVDYTELPEELDIEDVPKDRLTGLRRLLYEQDEGLQYRSAFLLTSWGVDEGFYSLMQMFSEGKTDGYIYHRLHNYDETDAHILNALTSYWASKGDEGKGEKARQVIFPYISQIIEKSKTEYFGIAGMFLLITSYHFNEYLPLVKEHLAHIIDFPDTQYWKIHDDLKLLLHLDPEFVSNLLEKKKKSLADFGIEE